jgi:hypothetical protein
MCGACCRSQPGVAANDADYAVMSRIKRVADHDSVAVVLVHHVRRAPPPTTFLATMAGAYGLAGEGTAEAPGASSPTSATAGLWPRMQPAKGGVGSARRAVQVG